jgi:hypothetical protein
MTDATIQGDRPCRHGGAFSTRPPAIPERASILSFTFLCRAKQMRYIQP